jgi:hypothetical protein
MMDGFLILTMMECAGARRLVYELCVLLHIFMDRNVG